MDNLPASLRSAGPSPATFTPARPFEEWPVQFFDARLGFAWYCEPSALVIQTVVTRGTITVARALNDVIDGVLKAHAAELVAAGGLLLLQDWRTLKGYDKDAREHQFARMRARKPGYARQAIVVVAPANRLLRMAVETAGLFATVSFGSRIELATQPRDALRKYRIRAPIEGASLV